MSKAEGKKIGIKFSLPLTNDFTVSGGEIEVSQGKNVLFSKQYDTTTYKATNVVDGNLTTNWIPAYFSISEWVAIDLGEILPVNKIELRSCTMNYYPTYTVEGSIDNVNWEQIITGTHSATAQTKTHTITGTYRYIKIIGTSPSSVAWAGYSDIKIYSVGESYINNSAFTVSGQEYQWFDGSDNNGKLIAKTYPVLKVDIHPTELNSILLEFEGFRNVQGDITISYNQALGNLAGSGGEIASFEETFTPTDLTEGLTATGLAVGTHEHISANVGGAVELIYIEKLSAYSPAEYIQASVGGTVQLINIKDINP